MKCPVCNEELKKQSGYEVSWPDNQIKSEEGKVPPVILLDIVFTYVCLKCKTRIEMPERVRYLKES